MDSGPLSGQIELRPRPRRRLLDVTTAREVVCICLLAPERASGCFWRPGIRKITASSSSGQRTDGVSTASDGTPGRHLHRSAARRRGASPPPAGARPGLALTLVRGPEPRRAGSRRGRPACAAVRPGRAPACSIRTETTCSSPPAIPLRFAERWPNCPTTGSSSAWVSSRAASTSSATPMSVRWRVLSRCTAQCDRRPTTATDMRTVALPRGGGQP